MSAHEWEFSGEPWWDDAHQAMKFILEKSSKYHTCAISQVVLNDYFCTEDTKDAAVQNYHTHSDDVRSLATRLIQDGLADGEGVFFITSDICRTHLHMNI